jgi:hypothetical protein
MTKGRRQLRFDSLDDVPPDVDRLLLGHRTLGRWSLAQICNHLAAAIDCTIDGFPDDVVPSIVRKTLGAPLLAVVLATGRITEGAPLPARYRPVPDLDPANEADRLRRAIARFHAAPEPLAPHPLFGRMSHDRWRRYHCIHCAHHLSFVNPVTAVTR